MTPPPTSAEEQPPRTSRLAALWEKSAGVFHEVQDALPPPRSAGVWLHLLRVPNLLTVPGDVLAGFLLAPATDGAGWGRLVFAAAAGLFFYSAGLIANDLFDYKVDLRERPWRPLPAGKLSRETAAAAVLVAAWIAVFLGAFASALFVALPLLACIFLYDVGLKHHRLAGPVLMGACRAGNLLLGAAAAEDGLAIAVAPALAAVLLGLYIAAVTHLARGEARPGARFTPARIGRLLGLLIPLQALLGLAAVHRFPANLLGLLLLPLLPLHRRLARRFPPS